jgi:hypothetical protein
VRRCQGHLTAGILGGSLSASECQQRRLLERLCGIRLTFRDEAGLRSGPLMAANEHRDTGYRAPGGHSRALIGYLQ